LPPALRRSLDEIESWVAGRQPLKQNTAAQLRKIITQAVVNQCKWDSPLMAEPAKAIIDTAWPARSIVVSITGADAENQASETTPIKFDRDARNAVFFRRLLALQAGVDDPGNTVALRRLASLARQHQPDLQRAIMRHRQTDDDSLTTGFAGSLLGASLAGKAWPGMDDSQLLAVAFDDGADWTLGDAALRPARWVSIWQAHRQVRPDLIRALREAVGVRRGNSGAVRMIDTARALNLVRKAAVRWRWEPTGPVPDWCKPAVTDLSRLPDLIKEHYEQLVGLDRRLQRWMPAEVTRDDTLTEIETACRWASDVALLPDGVSAGELKTRIDRMKEDNSRVAETLRQQLAKCELISDEEEYDAARTRVAVVDRGPQLEDTIEFFALCDGWLTTKVAEARRRDGGLRDAVVARVQQVHADWAAIVRGTDE
jgi:hypothetical protein